MASYEMRVYQRFFPFANLKPAFNKQAFGDVLESYFCEGATLKPCLKDILSNDYSVVVIHAFINMLRPTFIKWCDLLVEDCDLPQRLW